MDMRFPLHLEILANESAFLRSWTFLPFAGSPSPRMIHVLACWPAIRKLDVLILTFRIASHPGTIMLYKAASRNQSEMSTWDSWPTSSKVRFCEAHSTIQ